MQDEIIEKAREIWRQIARKGQELVTGGCTGIPYDAVLGACEVGGKCIAYSPAKDLKTHQERDGYPVDGFSEFVFVPEVISEGYIDINDRFIPRQLRDVASVSNVNAGIIIDGDGGTMHEFVLLHTLGRNIGILEGSGGVTTKLIPLYLETVKKDRGSKIIYDSDSISLVDRLIEL